MNSNLYRKYNYEIYEMIYEMMILPIITYSTSIKPTLTRTQLAKLSSIENRVNEIVGREKHIPRLEKLIQKKACLTVRKCLDNDVCCNFQGYFETNNRNQRTRNNSKLVKLPKVKLEYARQSFRYVAAKIYNDLPISMRAEGDFKVFKKSLDSYCI